jgi:hypothetical protein
MFVFNIKTDYNTFDNISSTPIDCLLSLTAAQAGLVLLEVVLLFCF